MNIITISKSFVLLQNQEVCQQHGLRYSMADDSWVKEFREIVDRHLGIRESGVHGVYRKNDAAFGSAATGCRILFPENAVSTNEYGWLESQRYRYRPKQFVLHDVLICAAQLSADCEQQDIAETAARLVRMLNSAAYFPTAASERVIGIAWHVEIQEEREYSVQERTALAYAVLAAVCGLDNSQDLENRELLDYGGEPFVFGSVYKLALRKTPPGVPSFPLYLVFVPSNNEPALLAAEKFEHYFLDQLMVPEIKASYFFGTHPVLKGRIAHLSDELERHTSEQLRRVQTLTGEIRGDADERLLNMAMELKTNINAFMQQSVSIQRNAQNAEAVVKAAAESFRMSAEQGGSFARIMTRDICLLRDQYLADREWMLVEQNTVLVASDVLMLINKRNETVEKERANAAGLWLAAVGLILAIVGIPDWYPGDQEFSALSTTARTLLLAAIFLAAVYLFRAGQRSLRS